MKQAYRDDRDYRVRKLSESDKGRGILVAATSSAGTLIHTALNSVATNEWDALTLRVVNKSSSAIKLTLEWGGTDSADHIEVTVPAEAGLLDLIAGHVLNNGAEVRAFADTANELVIHGFVQRYGDSRI